MKKLFTLVFALLGFAGVINAATADDVQTLKHSYVLVFDQYTSDGTGSRTKGALFGDSHFLDVTGGSVNSGGKGSVDLATMTYDNKGTATPLEYLEGNITPEEIAALQEKYGEYGTHINSLRLKNTQDVICCKPTAGSVLYVFGQGNNKSGKDCRVPKFAKTADLADALNDAPTADWGTMNIYVYKFVVPGDFDGNVPLYIGSYNGDSFFSYIIIEANEAPGTPTVKVGDQTYEGGLWFKEVTCKANDVVEEGSTEKIPTIVTYTTDGTAPTAASPIYSAPIKCYQDMTVKFQAFMDFGDGKPTDDFILDGADNDANVNFIFDAPTIEADGAKIKVVSPYEGQGAINFFKLNDGFEIEDNEATLTESATVTAFTKIDNGVYGTFTSKSTTKDVYVLNPIKEKKTITVAGSAVVDEEATAASTDGSTIYKIEDGIITVDKADFFVKNLTFAALANADAAKAQYQVPAGQEAYIQMSNTNITFMVAEGDSVTVKVICSKNACKNIDADDAAEDKLVNGCTPDRSCYVNVSGTNYCHLDELGGVAADQKLFPDANIIEFGLKGAEGGSIFTFQKYSGTGNILISSIEITPAEEPVEGNEVDITSKFTYTWNASESFVNNADGSITFNAVQWGGLAAWLKDGDNPADWSDYSKLVFEYAEPTTVSTQILVSGTEAKAWGDAGITSLECSFEGLDMTTVEQVALQAADATTITIKRVYLVKKGGDEPVPADPNNLVKNWDCSGDDASSFWVHEWRTMDTQTDGPANLVDGTAMVYVRSFAQAEAAGNATLVDGSKPVAADNFADWDSQFFITWDEAKATAAGDKLQLKMKVKADKAQAIASQLHKAPGAYVHWYAVGDINVTTEWTDFVSAEVDVVSGDPGWGKTAEGCWTIAFNLAKGEENTIYFDDMVVYVIKPTGITEMYRINPEDGVRYNLAGKRVDDSYKGIVIMNGKKMLQK